MEIGKPNLWGITREVELIPGLSDFIVMRKPYVEAPEGFGAGRFQAIGDDAVLITDIKQVRRHSAGPRTIIVKYIDSDEPEATDVE